ncbi:Peptidyl-prolyl cis-trans isomerase-like 1 [Spiromyces aspiralis]|uniref:Peptidyl-prolyl cis-trans isomerase-like 1 n=1 Tax=Spiromyces aspiralis TaxID=68401 RepID=A0ACC1HK04_9FUNG|nr:Peptidyl-prolyl cis-trans isomerase-like 1 [Spiromyces aspiralis]
MASKERGNVLLRTNMGDIEFELYWDHAPKTCHNFYQLAKRKYYCNVIFHRIISNFVIQGGDPTGTGAGGQSIYGQASTPNPYASTVGKFEDEFTSKLKHTGAGILSMANSGPNTNGSQFFITLAPLPHLDNKHTIFGRVKSGMRVVEQISKVRVDSRDRQVE